MPGFVYTAIDKKGKKKKGTVQAENKIKAQEAVKALGLTPISFAEENVLNKDLNITIGAAVKVKELSLFCRQFTSILRAGVPLNDALGMLAEQTDNKGFAKAITDVQSNIQKGDTLSESMRRHPKYFSKMMVNLVQAGEASGSLDTSLERLSVQLEKDAKLGATVKKALMYPIIVLCVAVVVVIFMLAVVVPKFMDMFNDMDIEMPWLTLAVVAASEFVQSNIILIIAILIGLVIGIMAFKKTETGQYFFARLPLLIPALKTFISKTSASKMARTLTTLLSAGLPMIEALEITANTMTNVIFRDSLLHAREAVMKGIALSEPLKQSNLFPSMVVHMVKIGEETGDMKDLMNKMADYYDDETEQTTQQLMAFLEPMIILLLAGVVGVLVGAVVMPMLSLYTGLDAL